MFKILYVFMISLSVSAQSLDSLIEMSIRKNPILKSYTYEIQSVKKKAEAVSYLPDPVFQGVYFPKEIVTANGPQVAQLSFIQMFPWFGTLSLKKEILNKSSEIVSEHMKQKQVDIIFNISKYYYIVASTELKDALLENYSELLEGFYQSALSRYENGNGMQHDVLKTQTEISLIKNKRITLKIMREKALSAINKAGHLSLSSIHATFPKERIQLEPKQVRENHTIRSLIKRQEQVDLKKDLTTNKSLPKMSLGIKYHIIDEKLGVSGNQDAFGISVGFSLPIFSGAYRDEEDAYVLESSSIQQKMFVKQSELKESISFLEFEIEQQSNNLDLLQNDLIPKAQLALKSAISGYETGTQTFLSLLDAKRMLLNLQLQEVDTRKRYYISLASYKKETTILKDGSE